MSDLSSLSDDELVARLPALVQTERQAMADVIEHLVEVERRRLYLAYATSSLYRYCIDRLGYAEDAALKRHRVAQLALRVPEVLEDLRNGTIHLTGLFLLSKYLTEENATAILEEARGRSRRGIEELIAQLFPRPDVAASVALLEARSDVTCSGAGNLEQARLEPLSPTRVRVEFTARAELYDKLQQARELLSHALPGGDLGALFERALDALLEKETRRRFGAGRPRKRRELKQGSRHIPVEVERAVWERDGAQCTFVDNEGRRCSERHYLTIEHRQPFALQGPPTLDNLCLLCGAHNLASARAVFGDERVEASIADQRRRDTRGRSEPQLPAPEQVRSHHASSVPQATANAAQALAALCRLGFPRREAAAAIAQICGNSPGLEVEQLLRKSLPLLVPTRAKAA
ncbi:MAG TPA: RuvA C-terminal domain-containing protein [Polyangiaceae bacterium]|nr:RuvA C-terminal domain-containing protein [Polyangiaceae bacterium]